MKVTDLSNFKIECDLPIQSIKDISIHTEVNHHGKCEIQGMIGPDVYKEYAEQFTGHLDIRIIYEAEKRQVIIFAGRTQEITFCEMAGVYEVTIMGVSHSKQLDKIKNNRSYQKISMSYQQLFREIGSPYGAVILAKKSDRCIPGPFIQYNKTSWEFLMYLADVLTLPVIPDCAGSSANIFIGVQQKSAVKPGEILTQKATRHLNVLRRYKNIMRGAEKDFICYQIETYEYYGLGERIILEGAEWIVTSTYSSFRHGLMTHVYLLMQERSIGYFYKKEDGANTVSLAGTVLSTQENTVKLHLDIDQYQKEEDAYPYQYYPVTGNVMYCMPEKGAKVILTVTEHFEGHGIVTHCLQEEKNGSNFKEKQMHTDQKKMLLLGEHQMIIGSLGKRRSQHITFKENAGINVSSELPVVLNSQKNIKITAVGGVSVCTSLWMEMKQANTQNKIVLSGNEIVHTAIQHHYSSGKQKPKTFEQNNDVPYFPSMELAGDLFGMFSHENSDPAVKALMGAQPIACSPNPKTWKAQGTGFGSR